MYSKRSYLLLLLAGLLVPVAHLSAQLLTMGKECRELLEKGQSALEARSYQQALTALNEFSEQCKTKDAKRLAAAGKAEAYNGLGEYRKAIAEAETALRLTKNKSLEGHFQKGVALHHLGDAAGAKAELDQVIALTEKNENVKERASNYALMAALYDRQLNQRDSAFYFLDKAMEMDPGNAAFWIQKGDMYVAAHDYDRAFEAYDRAVAMGRTDLEMYIIRSEAGLKRMEHKYGTTQAQALRDKMTAPEKASLCADLQKALSMGWNDMNKDLFAALVCK